MAYIHKQHGTSTYMVVLSKHHKLQGGKITKYLIFEGFDSVVQATLLIDVDVPSLVEPTDGVWMRM
jgi:hypothetical protein